MNKNITIGMDLGDKFHIAVVFDEQGNELEASKTCGKYQESGQLQPCVLF